ncbi:MAG: ATP-binding protein [Fimbriimonadaceae bacterium]|nr:ATP-binding protein [Fimbriimonadaceae bacterium]
MSTEEAITRLVQCCDPTEPLAPGDPRYVNCDAVRQSALQAEMLLTLRRAREQRFIIRLFTGHRGVGKSTELRRLQRALEEGPPPFQVVFIDLTEHVDLGDLDFPDLLVVMAAQCQQQLADSHVPGFGTATTLLQQAYDSVRETLSAEVITSAGWGGLSAEIRNRPTRRSVLRAAVEQHNNQLREALNDLLDKANQQLRRQGKKGLVIIVDGLERVELRDTGDGRTTHDRLYFDRADQLAGLRTHVLYTAPVSLVYSPRCQQLKDAFGGTTHSVPMIPLKGYDQAGVPASSPGLDLLEAIVAARCQVAGVALEEVFEDRSLLRRLCLMSGGHPRTLLRFLQSALNMVLALPLREREVERVLTYEKIDFTRQVPDAFWPLLASFAKPQKDMPQDEPHQMMLLLQYIYEYLNGHLWYEVNPVIAQLERFQQR